ncbi:MAG TPA: hypothetical protein VFE58_00115, partial [Tepidisphaeraceae bacterium]|nr:hypothetical protein [Tepidisphaeraceae bacterium]
MGLWSRWLARRVDSRNLHRSVRKFHLVMEGARWLVPGWFAVGVMVLGWQGVVYGALGWRGSG